MKTESNMDNSTGTIGTSSRLGEAGAGAIDTDRLDVVDSDHWYSVPVLPLTVQGPVCEWGESGVGSAAAASVASYTRLLGGMCVVCLMRALCSTML